MDLISTAFAAAVVSSVALYAFRVTRTQRAHNQRRELLELIRTERVLTDDANERTIAANERTIAALELIISQLRDEISTTHQDDNAAAAAAAAAVAAEVVEVAEAAAAAASRAARKET
jgi:septal ring factor EnvC (AmiA/AmiB activator)